MDAGGRSTQEAKAEIFLPDYRDVGDEFFPEGFRI
jgi:hypothetical protein